MRNNGKYYYAPHRSQWGIWRNTEERRQGTTVLSADFIKDCPTREEAEREVYRLNGWRKKSEE